MTIVLIIPPSPGKSNIIRLIDCSHEAKASYLWQPNDFLIITSRLDPSDGVVLIDGTADGLDEAQYLQQLGAAEGHVVIFALSSVSWDSDHAYFLKTKQRFPSQPFYVLGDIFLEESYRRFILQDCSGIIFNPYMLDLRAMHQAGNRPGGVMLPGVVARHDQPPFPEGKKMLLVDSRPPRHGFFLKKGYRFPFAKHYRFSTVTTMWGCPFACSYCTDSNFPPVVRSFQDVLEELASIQQLGVQELFFADKVFAFSRQNADPLLRAMAERFRFSWSCYFHPQVYDAGLLDLMKRAGCHTIITGIDSADVPSLERYQRRVEQQKIDELLNHANRIGISVCADFILGLEHETEEDILRTIRFALEKPIDFASFNIAAPLPGSDIRSRLTRAGQLVFGREGFDTGGRRGILGNENISAERLRKLRKQAFRKFYLRPAYWAKRLARTTSLEHLLIQLGEMLSMLRKYS